MNCGNCDKNDGLCYTSFPTKVKCTITKEFHGTFDECNVDFVPVVRCKDCKWYQESELLAPNKFCFRLKGKDGKRVGYNFSDDDFCSRGERA